jgi:hypothetical protein
LRHWQDKLNLKNWRITVSKQQLKTCMAMTDKFDDDQHTCRIRLGTKWPEKWYERDVELLAVHELLHILFHDLVTEAINPAHELNKVYQLEHHVINILEPLLVPINLAEDY